MFAYLSAIALTCSLFIERAILIQVLCINNLYYLEPLVRIKHVIEIYTLKHVSF